MVNLAEMTLRAASAANRVDRSEGVDRDHVVVLVQERMPEMVTASRVGWATEFLEDLMRATGADRVAERAAERVAEWAAVQVGKMET